MIVVIVTCSHGDGYCYYIVMVIFVYCFAVGRTIAVQLYCWMDMVSDYVIVTCSHGMLSTS